MKYKIFWEMGDLTLCFRAVFSALDPSYARDLRIQQFEVQQKISDQIRTYQQQNLLRGR